LSREVIEAARREKRIQKKSIVGKDIIIIIAGIIVVAAIAIVGEIKLGSRIIKRNYKDIAITVSRAARIVVEISCYWRAYFDSIGDSFSCTTTTKA